MVRVPVLVLGLCILITILGSPTGAVEGFDLSTSHSLDTPDRTVRFQGLTFNVSQVTRVRPNQTVTVRTKVPNQTLHRVLLYNSDRQILQSEHAFESSSHNFTLNYPPGSYLFSLHQDGVHQRVHPVVITNYRLTVDAPSTTSPQTPFNVEVSVAQIRQNESPARIQVVIANSSHEFRRTADRRSNRGYSVMLTLKDISPGSYRVYAIAQGKQRVFGHRELLGISDSTSLTFLNSTPTNRPNTTAPSVVFTETQRTDSSTDQPVITPYPESRKTTSTATRLPGFTPPVLLLAICLLLLAKRTYL